ncbi:MAG: class I SAM-dependent methyltransferase, partial [Gammaproteobacteria bacterium]|nr:class I SAM-dependent methyltransferase [Gammaproteobacteria bacterium]
MHTIYRVNVVLVPKNGISRTFNKYSVFLYSVNYVFLMNLENNMSKKPIFKEFAKYYDLLYSWKNYKNESNTIKNLIKKHKKSLGNDLLEMACGTGKHLPYFKDSFSILATDINRNMLSIARKNITGVQFKLADMTQFDLGKKFDVILCLFSSIAYIKTYKNLNKTIKNFSEHLKKGGVVIIEPWFTEA